MTLTSKWYSLFYEKKKYRFVFKFNIHQKNTSSFFWLIESLIHFSSSNLPNTLWNVVSPLFPIFVERYKVPGALESWNNDGILWPISQQPPSSAVKRNIDLKSLPVSHPLNRRSVKCFRKSHYWFVIVKVFTLPKIVIIIQATEKDVLK